MYFYEKRGSYRVKCYRYDVTNEMRNKALDFAKKIILSDNQYSRLLPKNVFLSNDIELKKKIEIQRTYMGKLGEIAFLKLLQDKSKEVDTSGMFTIYEGQRNTDNFDFITDFSETVDVKTGFRYNHSRFLVNLEQFNSKPKNFYVAVKLNASDTNIDTKLVDWFSVTHADILGFVEFDFLNEKCEIKNFGEGDAKFITYNRLLGIDKLISRFK
ncbi:TPA: hypothetical protein ACGO4K_001369 [Streptococcus suis]